MVLHRGRPAAARPPQARPALLLAAAEELDKSHIDTIDVVRLRGDHHRSNHNVKQRSSRQPATADIPDTNRVDH